MKFNFDDVASIDLVTDGVYDAVIVAVEEKVGKKSCKKYWKISYKIVENDEFKGAIVTDSLFFSPKALGRAKLCFSKLGFSVNDPDLEIEPNDLIDKELQIKVKSEDKEGQKWNKLEYRGFYSSDEIVEESNMGDAPF